MAGHQYLSQISAQVRDEALGTLQALLRSKGDEDEGRFQEALESASRDIVGSQGPQFQLNAIAAALVRVLAVQQEEIDTLKRTKANASSLQELKK